MTGSSFGCMTASFGWMALLGMAMKYLQARLERVKEIFILQHGPRNRFARIPYARAVAELFARSFPPFHSSSGLANTVDFLDRALANTPCHEFEFTPDDRAIEAVLRFHD